MKTLTVRLPEALVAELEAEARRRRVSKSNVVRERLVLPTGRELERVPAPQLIGDLVGSVGRLPEDLSSRTKYYLRTTGYGRKRPR